MPDSRYTADTLMPSQLIALYTQMTGDAKKIDPDDRLMKGRDPGLLARYRQGAANIRRLACRAARAAGYGDIVQRVIKERNGLTPETARLLLEVPRPFVEGMLYRHPVEVSQNEPSNHRRLGMRPKDRHYRAMEDNVFSDNDKFGVGKDNRSSMQRRGRDWIRESVTRGFWNEVFASDDPAFRLTRQREYRFYRDLADGWVASPEALKRLKAEYRDGGPPCITINVHCGYCPVEVEGLIDGEAFYFRARGAKWSIGIGGDPISAPDWEHAGSYGEWPEAGYMPDGTVKSLIRQAANLWRERSRELTSEITPEAPSGSAPGL